MQTDMAGSECHIPCRTLYNIKQATWPSKSFNFNSGQKITKYYFLFANVLNMISYFTYSGINVVWQIKMKR